MILMLSLKVKDISSLIVAKKAIDKAVCLPIMAKVSS